MQFFEKVTRRGLLGLAAAMIGAAPVAQAMPNDLTIVTSNAGGTFYPIGTAMAKILTDNGITVSVQPGGGNSNNIAVSEGKAELGLTFAPTFIMAKNGQGPFEGRTITNTRAIGQFYTNVTQIAVTSDSGVNSIADLAGKSFATQGKSAASSTFFRMVLEAAGISEDDLDIVVRGGPRQGADMVRDGKAIGFQATTGVPNGTFSEAFLSTSMKILPIDDATFAKVTEMNPAFARMSLPAGTYRGVDSDVPSMGAPAVVLVNAAMSDDDVYAIVKTLAENTEQLSTMHGALTNLTPEFMAKAPGVDIHPGAMKYYAEMGMM